MSDADFRILLMTQADLFRFWSKIYMPGIDDCWTWKEGRFDKGYGMFSISRLPHHAHRVAWITTHGVIPTDLYVCHECDNPPCCNPFHMFLGTAADNNHDCQRKGRASRGPKHAATVADCNRARGERNGFSKLTAETVRSIRQLVADGMTQVSISRKFGISQQTVSSIVTGQGWSHVS